VAHDFNNILTAILGTPTCSPPTSPQPTAAWRMWTRSARRLAAPRLTRQLLAFSRKQVLEPRVLGLNELVDNMDKMLRPILGENVEFRAAPAADLHAVRADPNQIEQVILNLAINARDAMPRAAS